MGFSFMGKPRHWNPRRVYRQTGAGWQQGTGFARFGQTASTLLNNNVTVWQNSPESRSE